MRSALSDPSTTDPGRGDGRVSATRADALFASMLQSSDHPGPVQVRQAIAAATRAHGNRGCAAVVAQEFGEHPETAVARMRWARIAVAAISGTPRARVRAQ